MIQKKVNDNKKQILLDVIVCLYSSLMVLYQLIPQILTIVISVLFYGYLYLKLSNDYDFISSLSIMSVIAIPTSTISVLGSSYSSLPLTWYNILIIIAFGEICLVYGLRKKYIIPIILFSMYGFMICISTNIVSDALKQYLMIILFFFSFFIGDYMQENVKSSLNTTLKKYYFLGVFSMALQVILQKIFISYTGTIVGHYATMGAKRVAYAGLMGDYSFTTLYLATGFMMIFIWYINTNKISFVVFCIVEILLLYAILVVSSRTGLISLMFTLALYTICNIKKINGKYLVILFMGLAIFPALLSKLMESRGGQALLDTSGRDSNYIESIELWRNKVAFGYGLGLDNLYNSTGLNVPHNLVIQYLIQIGLVGTILFCIPLIVFIKDNLLNRNKMNWLFWLVLIGSMFIPDIVSSRFLYGIVLICMTDKCNFQGEEK